VKFLDIFFFFLSSETYLVRRVCLAWQIFIQRFGIIVVVVGIGRGEGVEDKTNDVGKGKFWCFFVKQDVESQHYTNMAIVDTQCHDRVEVFTVQVEEHANGQNPGHCLQGGEEEDDHCTVKF